MPVETYGVPSKGKLRFPSRADAAPRKLEVLVHDELRALVLSEAFPCVGAKSAFHDDAYRFALYDDMRSPSAAVSLARDLVSFTHEQDTIEGFSTFVASFLEPVAMTEETFERELWRVLQRLDDRDSRDHAWDPEASSDPSDARFAFSIGGRAFFVVGLHAASSRIARRFAYPTLVFNAHAQFEALRWEGTYDRIEHVTRARDGALQGPANPSLAEFGAHSEAPQYAGRARENGETWRCPFHHGAKTR